jgi:Holliday junction resolvase RusA-like endonuclease
MTENGSAPASVSATENRGRKSDQLGGLITSENKALADANQDQCNLGVVTIVIGGPPTAKGRPRVTRRGFVYTPSKTRKFEAHGRLAAQQAMDGRPPITVPVRAEITIDLPVPASWSAKRRDTALRGDIRPTSRPDCDNYVKSALDAINNIVVTDDGLVVDLVVTKKYAAIPQLTITITPLPALAAQVRR